MDAPKRFSNAGDVIILSAKEWLTKDQIKLLEDQMSEKFPDASKVVVLHGGVEIEFVHVASTK